MPSSITREAGAVQVEEKGRPKAPAFTFFSVAIPLKAVWFEEEIYRKVEKVEEVEEEGKKK